MVLSLAALKSSLSEAVKTVVSCLHRRRLNIYQKFSSTRKIVWENSPCDVCSNYSVHLAHIFGFIESAVNDSFNYNSRAIIVSYYSPELFRGSFDLSGCENLSRYDQNVKKILLSTVYHLFYIGVFVFEFIFIFY